MQKLLLLGLVIIATLASFAWYKKQQHHAHSIPQQEQPIVVVLNGPSASGKSSIQKEFQNLMLPNLWIKVGIDNLFDKPMPDIEANNLDFWQKENSIRWVTNAKDENNHNVIPLHIGAQGQRVAYGMNNAIVGYALAGNNVIVDYIAYETTWLTDLQQKLRAANITTILVKIDIPLSILEEREKSRATSPQGHARSHYNSVHQGILYDLEIDTSKQSSTACAQTILDFITKKSSN